jgi:tetratricopeptide (TPR) repeat protein
MFTLSPNLNRGSRIYGLLPLLILAAIPMVRQTPHTDPTGQAIRIAARLTETANDELIRNWLFTLVISAREESGYAFVRQASSPGKRFQFYCFIADALTEVGESEKARAIHQKAFEAAMQIGQPDTQFAALAKLSARKGEVDAALEKASQITDSGTRSRSLSDICIALIQVKHFDGAIRAAHGEVFEWERPRLLLQIAKTLLETKQSNRAKLVAQEAFNLARDLPGGGSADVLRSFAAVLNRVGLTDELLEEYRRLQKRNIYISDRAFEAVAVGFAESGDTAKALAVARGLTAPVNDGCARALAAVSQALREAGHKDQAELILTEALDTALKIEFPSHRSWALHKIAPMLVRVGRIEEAVRAVRRLGLGANEPHAFVAVALIESGRLTEAKQIATEAFTSTFTLNFENTIIRSGVLIQLVQAMRNAGRVDEARNFVEIAHKRLAKTKGSHFQSNAYGVVAEAFAMVGNWHQAVATVELCEQPIDRLAACTAIVREYSVTHKPGLAEVFRKALR